MTYVNQTLYGIGRGNCLPACVASLTGIPLADIPHFVLEHEDWLQPLYTWLRERGFFALAVNVEAPHFPLPINRDCIFVVQVPGLTDDAHAVLGRILTDPGEVMNGMIVHDPGGKLAGMADAALVRAVIYIVKMDA